MEQLSDFFSSNEINNLIKSTSTGYYTPKLLIKFIYAYVQKMRFKASSILEPACGHGTFFWHMPKEMRKNSNIPLNNT